jgi:hypothetical protein
MPSHPRSESSSTRHQAPMGKDSEIWNSAIQRYIAEPPRQAIRRGVSNSLARCVTRVSVNERLRERGPTLCPRERLLQLRGERQQRALAGRAPDELDAERQPILTLVER